MTKQLFYLWMVGFVLLCTQALQAQSNQTQRPLPVKALVLEHKLDVSKAADAQQMETFANFLKEKFGKSNQLVYLYDVKTYAFLDRVENSPLFKNVKDEVSAKYQFISFKEMNEDAFGKQFPRELQRFNSGMRTHVEMKDNVASPGQKKFGN